MPPVFNCTAQNIGGDRRCDHFFLCCVGKRASSSAAEVNANLVPLWFVARVEGVLPPGW